MRSNQRGVANLALVAVLVVGLVVGLYLLKNQNTNTKSKASASIISAFEIKDANGKISQCQENTPNGVPICEIETLNYTITLKDPNVLQTIPTN